MVATSQRTCTPSPATEVTPWTLGHTGSPIAIPAISDKLVFIQVRNPVYAVRYRPRVALRDVPLRFNVLSTSGSWEQYRVVPSTLEDGVLVSTVVTDPDQLTDLYLTGGDADVKAISLIADRPSAWERDFSYRLFAVPAPPDHAEANKLFHEYSKRRDRPCRYDVVHFIWNAS